MKERTKEEEERAKRYAGLRHRLILVNFSFSLVYMVVVLFSGLSADLAAAAVRIAGPGPGATAVYLIAFVVLTTLVFLPLSFYSDYTVEHRFELSNQTPGGWLTDEIKGLAVSLVIVIPLGIGGYRLLGLALAWWWVYAAFLWTGFGFILAYLAPVLIMPLFNKFIPLDDAELKEEIVELAERAKLKLSDILRTDMSRRTKKANAFFAGIGNTKRIVLGDTLLEEYTRSEILTVIGHEMGHWKLGHLWKNTAADIVGSLAGFYMANAFLDFGIGYFHLRGLDDIAGLPLIILAFMLLGLVAKPAANALSRRFERQADIFELRLVGQPQAAISTFKKLAAQNLADPSPSPLIVFLLYSHPPVAERIETAARFGEGDAQPLA